MRRSIILNLILVGFIMFTSNLISGKKNLLGFNNADENSLEYGDLYFKRREYLNAVEMYNKAILKDYDNNDVYYKLSICYKELKKYIESIHCLDKAIKILENKIDKKEMLL